MSEKDKANLREGLDLAAKIAALVGPLVVAGLVLWLKSEFVTRSEYLRLSEQQAEMGRTLLILVEQRRDLARLAETDRDLEMRLRVVEARR